MSSEDRLVEVVLAGESFTQALGDIEKSHDSLQIIWPDPNEMTSFRLVQLTDALYLRKLHVLLAQIISKKKGIGRKLRDSIYRFPAQQDNWRKISLDDWKHFFRSFPNEVEIHLLDCSLDVIEMETIAFGSKCRSLDFRFHNQLLNARHRRDLVDTIAIMGRLERLIIAFDEYDQSHGVIVHFFHALARFPNKSLRHLEVKMKDVRGPYWGGLCSLLRKTKTLETFTLCPHNMCRQAVEECLQKLSTTKLLEAIEANTSLKDLKVPTALPRNEIEQIRYVDIGILKKIMQLVDKRSSRRCKANGFENNAVRMYTSLSKRKQQALKYEVGDQMPLSMMTIPLSRIPRRSNRLREPDMSRKRKRSRKTSKPLTADFLNTMTSLDYDETKV